eukprot:8754353-Alexandrium_andersonii.AAC.1
MQRAVLDSQVSDLGHLIRRRARMDRAAGAQAIAVEAAEASACNDTRKLYKCIRQLEGGKPPPPPRGVRLEDGTLARTVDEA